MVKSTRGRPVGRSDTRERLIAAARTEFFAHGYDGATVRSIAHSAGVDHAMVNYWFGSKEGLLRAVLEMTVMPGEVFDRVSEREPGDFATALLETVLGLWDRPEVGESFRQVMLAAATGGAAAGTIREYLGSALAARLEARIGGRDARRRAAAGAAMIAGIFVTRYVLHVEPIASLSRRDVVLGCAPSLRAALRESLGRR